MIFFYYAAIFLTTIQVSEEMKKGHNSNNKNDIQVSEEMKKGHNSNNKNDLLVIFWSVFSPGKTVTSDLNGNIYWYIHVRGIKVIWEIRFHIVK